MLRETLYQNAIKDLKTLSGEIEMDENMFGGRRPGKRGWGASGKNIVFGIYQRNGKVLTFPISSRARETMMPFIDRYTRQGVSTIPMTGLPIPLFLFEEITW
jgi:transposase